MTVLLTVLFEIENIKPSIYADFKGLFELLRAIPSEKHLFCIAPVKNRGRIFD